MLRTFRYPLRPNQAQEVVLESWRVACQQLYNGALEHRIGAWRWTKAARARGVSEEQLQKPVSYMSQTAELTMLRATEPSWRAIPAQVLRSPLRRVHRAYQNFFRRVKSSEKPGFPRFRSRDRYDSFSIGRARIDGHHVHVPKLGPVRFYRYRSLKGKVLDVTIRKESAGKWFVCIACDLGAAPPKVPVRADAMVGIDMGLTTFATVSDGTEITNPRYGRDGAALLARRQQALARKRRGSMSRKRAKRLVGKAHALIENRRKDHARKLAVFFCEKYDLIAHEDLNIRGMVHGNLARSIHDAAWGTFIHALTCKAEEAGKWVIPVDPRGTSQRCSACGTVVPKDLSVRTHDCPACGLRLGRDLNAAVNVLALGRSAVARGDPGTEGLHP
jgi:putative transposase